MKTVTAHYWLLDETNGLEDVAEGCGDEVDHGDEGCCAGVAAGPCSGRLEEGVEALEAGVGVGRGPALDGPQMLFEGLQGLAEGLEDAPQPLIGDLHNPRRRQNRISRTSVIAACSMRSVKRPPALAQGHLDPLDAVGRPASMAPQAQEPRHRWRPSLHNQLPTAGAEGLKSRVRKLRRFRLVRRGAKIDIVLPDPRDQAFKMHRFTP